MERIIIFLKIRPWSISKSTKGYYISHEVIKEKWDLIPKDTDILITHQPPFNILDLAWSDRYNFTEKCPHCGEIHKKYSHWGDPHLKKKVKEIKPKYHLFGHGF